MKNKLIEKAIVNHVYDGFPRRVGFPRQYLYHSVEAMLRKFWLYNGTVAGVYTAVFPENVKEKRKFNKFYFDLDSPGQLDQAYNDSITIINTVRDIFGVESRRYFSGKKGFAIYIDLAGEYTFKNYRAVHLQMTDLFNERGVTTIDPIVLGDVSRISRLPFNIHSSTGNLCIPVDNEWSLDEIKNNAVNYSGDYNVAIDPVTPAHDNYDLISQWDDNAGDYLKRLLPGEEIVYSKGFNINLERLLERASSTIGYRRVLIYRVIVPQLLQQGYSASDIHSFCRDYIERSGVAYDHSTKRFVDYYIYNYKQGWSPMSLTSLLVTYPGLKEALL